MGTQTPTLNRGKGKRTRNFKDKTMGWSNRKKYDYSSNQANEVIRTLQIGKNSVVRDLMDEFFLAFGGFLRVYTNESATRLADEHEQVKFFHRTDTHFAPKSVMSLTHNILVGEFCDRMYEDFGLIVEVATRDNRVLIHPAIPLGCVQDIRNKADMDTILNDIL